MTAIPLLGRFVRLEPLTPAHRDAMHAAAQDERIWEFNASSGFGANFDGQFAAALNSPNRWSYAVFHGDRLVGSSSFYDLQFAHRRASIGFTWFHPDVWRTAVNVEAKWLMLADGFERLTLARVAFDVDAINLRSRKAVEKLGAIQEGILRRHIVTYTGRVRDTVVYSILADDWSATRDRLDERLTAYGSLSIGKMG